MVRWEVAEVEKQLGVTWGKNADGKRVILERKTQKVPLKYPVLDTMKLQTPEDLYSALSEIMSAGNPGFSTVRQIAEHITYGLYNNAAQLLRRGADVRYTTAQRNAIKQVGGLVAAGVLDRETGVAALQRQGITDAEAIIEAFLSGEANGEDEEAAD